MKKPATHVADRGADLGQAGDHAVGAGAVGHRALDALDVGVELGVRDVQRAGAQPLADLVEALHHGVGEVTGALGHLLADEGEQQRDRADAQHHHDAGRGTARHPDPAQQVDQRHGERGDQQRDGERQGDHGEEAQRPQQAEHGDRDDDQPPRPGGREVEAPRHLRPAEVGRPGREGRLDPSLGAHLGPLADDALGEPLLVASRGREDAPPARLVGVVAAASGGCCSLTSVTLLSTHLRRRPTSRCAASGCSSASSPAAART